MQCYSNFELILVSLLNTSAKSKENTPCFTITRAGLHIYIIHTTKLYSTWSSQDTTIFMNTLFPFLLELQPKSIPSHSSYSIHISLASIKFGKSVPWGHWQIINLATCELEQYIYMYIICMAQLHNNVMSSKVRRTMWQRRKYRRFNLEVLE